MKLVIAVFFALCLSACPALYAQDTAKHPILQGEKPVAPLTEFNGDPIHDGVLKAETFENDMWVSTEEFAYTGLWKLKARLSYFNDETTYFLHTYTYNETGLLTLLESDHNGVVLFRYRYECDAAGKLVKQIVEELDHRAMAKQPKDSAPVYFTAQETFYDYDNKGRLTSITHNVDSTAQSATIKRYNSDGIVVREEIQLAEPVDMGDGFSRMMLKPAEVVLYRLNEQKKYSEKKRITSASEGAETQQVIELLQYEYDAQKRLVKERCEAPKESAWEMAYIYDEKGRLAETVKKRGQTTVTVKYTY